TRDSTTGRSRLLPRTNRLSNLRNRRSTGVDFEVHFVLATVIVATPANNSTAVLKDLLDTATLGRRERAHLPERVPWCVQINRGAGCMVRQGGAVAANGALGVTPVARPHQFLDFGVEAVRHIRQDGCNVALPHCDLSTGHRI